MTIRAVLLVLVVGLIASTCTGGSASEDAVQSAEATSDSSATQPLLDETAPNPVEQLLGALGNCLAVGYATNASAAGIEIDELNIKLEGDLDVQAFLGLCSDNADYGGQGQGLPRYERLGAGGQRAP